MLARTHLSTAISGAITGTGPDMLLIHGVGMNADYWGNLLPALSAHFRLTIVDMPGHGESPPLADVTPPLTAYTDAIAEVIHAPTLVVGHSMGALIALDLATRHPQSTRGIAALNGVYRRSAQAARAIQARVSQLDDHTTPDPTDTLARWFGESPTGTQAEASQQCRAWLEALQPPHYAAAYRAFANADAPADDLLASIPCPALFITGELEPNSTPAMSKAMSHLVAHSDCLIIEGAKHMMSLTHGPDVAQALIAFFDGDNHAQQR